LLLDKALHAFVTAQATSQINVGIIVVTNLAGIDATHKAFCNHFCHSGTSFVCHSGLQTALAKSLDLLYSKSQTALHLDGSFTKDNKSCFSCGRSIGVIVSCVVLETTGAYFSSIGATLNLDVSQ